MRFLVSDRFKLILGWSAKTGCTSAKIWFCGLHGLKTNPHTPPECHIVALRYQLVFKKKHDDYLKIAIIRDPRDRLLSGYEDKIVNANQSRRVGKVKINNLQQLLDELKRGRIHDHHFAPQTSGCYWKAKKRGWHFDYVVDLPFLTSRFADINAVLGVKVMMPHTNKTKSIHILDNNMARDVKKIYADDYKEFSALGYNYQI